MRRLHIIGRKNAGKTTLIVDLVRHLVGRGLRVGTIKHTHHHHVLDTPGKDSHRHGEAGASAVGILSPSANAVFWPSPEACHESERYDRFDDLMGDCDLVLVEGDSTAPAPRVEVWRAALHEEPYATGDTTIRAIVTDDDVPTDRPVWRRSDVSAVADGVLSLLDAPIG